MAARGPPVRVAVLQSFLVRCATRSHDRRDCGDGRLALSGPVSSVVGLPRVAVVVRAHLHVRFSFTDVFSIIDIFGLVRDLLGLHNFQLATP